MRCHDCQQVIEQYFDGELNEPVKSEVRSHLATCLTCSSLLRELTIDEKIYSGYTPKVGISPKVWAGVYARIAPVRSTSRLVPRLSAPLPRVNVWLTAALVILAIGLTAVFMKYVMSPAQNPASQSAIDRPPETPSSTQEKAAQVAKHEVDDSTAGVKREIKVSGDRGERTPSFRDKKAFSPRAQTNSKTRGPEQLVHEAEQKYLAAIAMLSRTIERRRTSVDPETRAKLEQALVSIDRTIAGTRRVVRQHPDDPIAVKYMLAAYSKKVDVLRQMSNY
ncbi:MAG: anti-sigma factor family protein [Pyrinomonadaceae bacterium]